MIFSSTVCYSRSRVLRRTAEFLFDLLATKESGKNRNWRNWALLLGVCLFSYKANKAAISIGMREGESKLTPYRVSGPHTLFLVDAVSFTVDRKDSSLFFFIASCLFSSTQLTITHTRFGPRRRLYIRRKNTTVFTEIICGDQVALRHVLTINIDGR